MTLNVTNQQEVLSTILPLSRRYSAHCRFQTRMMNEKFATDTVYSKDKSLSGHIGSQTYSHKNGFTVAYHLHKATGDTLRYSLSSLVHEYGRLGHLTFDGILTQKGNNTLFMKTMRRAQIPFYVSHPYRPNENPAERCIRKIKRRMYRIMYIKFRSAYGTLFNLGDVKLVMPQLPPPATHIQEHHLKF